MLKFVAILALATVALAHHETVNSMQQVKIQTIYDSVVTKEYNPNVRPYGVNGTDATHVTLQLVDVHVVHVDESKGVFTFQAYARQSWVDPRLAYNDTGVSYIPLRECKGLWYPDTFFLNGIDTSSFPKQTNPLAKTYRFFPNGRVFSSFRLTQTIHCPAFFKTGVKDVVCPVRVGSYGFFSDEVKILFRDGGEGVTTVKDQFLPKFTFGGVTTHPVCDGVEKTKVARSGDDEGHTHSCIQADFKFTRL